MPLRGHFDPISRVRIQTRLRGRFRTRLGRKVRTQHKNVPYPVFMVEQSLVLLQHSSTRQVWKRPRSCV